MIDGYRAQLHAKDIKFMVSTYNSQLWNGLRDHVDIFDPQNNECFNYLSPTGAALVPPGKETWSYVTRTSHQWIDAPGISQRMWAPKQRVFGSTGILVWNIIMWWDERPTTPYYAYNPWINPSSNYGNGALAYFYPPSPLGTGLPAKDMTIVPSLRLVLTRDGVEDFEYAEILERLIEEAESLGLNTGEAVKAMAMFNRQIASPKSCRLSEAYWEDAREAAARAIVNLLTPEITRINYDSSSDTVTISWTVLPDRNYQLYYSETLGAGENWTATPGSYNVNEGIATQVLTMGGGIKKRFFKVETW